METNTEKQTVQDFYFNTGVKPWNSSYLAEGDKFINNEKHILFQCENVPEGSIFQFAAPKNDVPTYNKQVKIFPIVGGNLCSKFAYFLTPSI